MGILLAAAAVALLAVSDGRAYAGETAAAAGPTTSSDPASPNSILKGSAEASWPQWRGPTRDGVVHGGPKLLDAWPKEGPKLLWKSGPIPATGNCYAFNGGSGCVAVSDGRAFVYVNTLSVVKLVDTKDLNDLGWEEGVPDDLGKKLDKEWEANRDKWRKLKPEEWDAYVKDYMAKLDPDLVKKLGSFIQKRMNQMKRGNPVYNSSTEVQWTPWDSLTKLAAIRGKKFTSHDELNRMLDDGLHMGHGGPLMGAGGMLKVRCFSYMDTVICLDAATGKEIWRKDFPGESGAGHRWTGGWAASSTPTICDEKCYVTGSAGTYCLSAKDGAVLWQAKTRDTSSSPLVANGAVFFVDGGDSADSALAAYDSKNGKLLWRQPKVRSTLTSPVAWTCAGKDYLIVDGTGGPFCVNPEDGTIVGKNGKLGGDMQFSTPAISGDVVVLLAGSGGLRAYGLTPEKLDLMWKMDKGDRAGSVVIHQGYVYTGGQAYNGGPACVDIKTGELKWKAREGEECSSPVVADGKIFFELSREGHVAMFKATPEKYEELGRFNPHMADCSSPAIAGGKMFLRLQDCVACYDLTASGN
jgi:outer membrane protein assembly factor BamB